MTSTNAIKAELDAIKLKMATASELERKDLAEAGNELVVMYMRLCG